MRTVYKYTLDVTDPDTWTIKCPQGGKVIHVDSKFGDYRYLQIWMEVDTETILEVKSLFVIGTGHPVPEGFYYAGTFVSKTFVWHVYEEIPGS